MRDLNQICEQLNALIEEAAADIGAREAALADVLERASQDERLRAAFNDGMAARQGQILALIEHQMPALQATGENPLALQTLRRMILSDD